MRTETKVLREKGWGPISEVTAEMVVAHTAKHPDPFIKKGAWLLRGLSGLFLGWSGDNARLSSDPDYNECCPLDSRGEPVDIVVEVPVHRSAAEVRAEILCWLLIHATGETARQSMANRLDEYAEAVLAERGDK